MKLSLLSTRSSPLLGHILSAMACHGVTPTSVVFDAKDGTDKEREIWLQRTGGMLPSGPSIDPSIEQETVSSHCSRQLVEYVRRENIELLVNAGTPRILNDTILSAPRIGVLNCHPGLLPEFRGCTCVEWALYLNEPIGNTAHIMTREIDEGPIVLREETPIPEGARYQEIRVAVYLHGFDLLARAVRLLQEQPSLAKGSYQRNGRYFSVIEEEKLNAVHERLLEGGYEKGSNKA